MGLVPTIGDVENHFEIRCLANWYSPHTSRASLDANLNSAGLKPPNRFQKAPARCVSKVVKLRDSRNHRVVAEIYGDTLTCELGDNRPIDALGMAEPWTTIETHHLHAASDLSRKVIERVVFEEEHGCPHLEAPVVRERSGLPPGLPSEMMVLSNHLPEVHLGVLLDGNARHEIH